jgi:mRNA interferase RelE/StbE
MRRDAGKFIDRIPQKHARQILEKIEALRVNPEPGDSSPLRGAPYRRADAGEYRIIYRFEDTTLFVVPVGKRNDDDVYRQLKRLGGD